MLEGAEEDEALVRAVWEARLFDAQDVVQVCGHGWADAASGGWGGEGEDWALRDGGEDGDSGGAEAVGEGEEGDGGAEGEDGVGGAEEEGGGGVEGVGEGVAAGDLIAEDPTGAVSLAQGAEVKVAVEAAEARTKDGTFAAVADHAQVGRG